MWLFVIFIIKSDKNSEGVLSFLNLDNDCDNFIIFRFTSISFFGFLIIFFINFWKSLLLLFIWSKTQPHLLVSKNFAFSNWWLSNELGRGTNIAGRQEANISATVDPPDLVIIKFASLNLFWIFWKKQKLLLQFCAYYIYF